MRNLMSFAYTYDNADQRIRVAREDGRVIHYEYDAIGQLTNASGGVYQYGYQYDETGNPVVQNKSGFIVSNAFNPLNQNVESGFSGTLALWGSSSGPLPVEETRINGNAVQPWGTGWMLGGLPFVQGTNSFEAVVNDVVGRKSTNTSSVVVQDKAFAHDLNGNMTRNDDTEYFWDDENRLIGVKKAGQLIQQNRYDGLSRRVEKIEYTSESAITNRYVYDGWNAVAVLDGGNGMLETYIHGIDLSGEVGGKAGGVGGILSGSMDENVCVYHYDGNGNIVLTTGEDGDISAQLEYSPFGEVLVAKGYLPRYQFSTKEYDVKTDLNYYGFRFYSAACGRWLNMDPIRERGFMLIWPQELEGTLDVVPCNLYVFVGNMPINGSDALGLDYSLCQNACNQVLAQMRQATENAVTEALHDMYCSLLRAQLAWLESCSMTASDASSFIEAATGSGYVGPLPMRLDVALNYGGPLITDSLDEWHDLFEKDKQEILAEMKKNNCCK